VPRVGIIAYGSLIGDPGCELVSHIVDGRSLRTPFRVEFARSSSTRCGAPTLVPVRQGGARVSATVLLLDETLSLSEAEDRLWRRETGNVRTGKLYPRSSRLGRNSVRIERHRDPAGSEILLYTEIAANIDPLHASALAGLALQSARGESGAERRDGICYLAAALEAGIETPLSEEYRAEVLARTRARDLEEAWERVSGGRR